TSPRPRCAPRTRRSPWRPRTWARWAGWWRCATGCATWRARTCWTRRPASTRSRTSGGSSATPTSPWCGWGPRGQGSSVAPGTRLGLADVGDLARPGVRYVNRQRGAGTRVLLDHELAVLGITPADVDGYAREEPTHLAVAAAVAAGRGDAGLGILAAARAFGLGFVPVTREPYDLAPAAP